MAEVVFYASRGEEPVLDYIRALGKRRAAEAAAVERYIDLLEEFGERLTMPYSRLIDRELRMFELRPGSDRVRALRSSIRLAACLAQDQSAT